MHGSIVSIGDICCPGSIVSIGVICCPGSIVSIDVICCPGSIVSIGVICCPGSIVSIDVICCPDVRRSMHQATRLCRGRIVVNPSNPQSTRPDSSPSSFHYH